MGVLLAMLALCSPAAAQDRGGTLVFIGTQGSQILVARLDPESGALTSAAPAGAIERPTWIAVDDTRPILFAVSEIGNRDGQTGKVASFAIDNRSGKLRPISAVGSGGNGPTHLSFDPRSATLFVAHYGGGQVTTIPVARNGALGPVAATQVNIGRGPLPAQSTAHAHAALLDRSGRHLLVPDMGADRIFLYRFDPKTRRLSPGDPAAEATPPGTGPRHLTLSADGRFAYLVTEQGAEVRVYGLNGRTGALRPLQTDPLDGPDFVGTRSGAEIILARDGRHLYVSNRTKSSIVVYTVDRATGRIRRMQEIATGGTRPRSFAIDPSGKWLLAGNQDSLTISIFAIDRARGTLTSAGKPVAVSEKPVSFAFYPQSRR